MRFNLLCLLCLSNWLGLAKASISYILVEEGEIKGRSFQKYRAFEHEHPVSIRKWIEALQQGDSTSLTSTLSQAPYHAFYWEVPPVTQATMQDGLEFVLVDAPSLSKRTARFKSFEKACEQASSKKKATPLCASSPICRAMPRLGRRVMSWKRETVY